MKRLIAFIFIAVITATVWFFFFYGVIKFLQECSCETIK